MANSSVIAILAAAIVLAGGITCAVVAIDMDSNDNNEYTPAKKTYVSYDRDTTSSVKEKAAVEVKAEAVKEKAEADNENAADEEKAACKDDAKQGEGITVAEGIDLSSAAINIDDGEYYIYVDDNKVAKLGMVFDDYGFEVIGVTEYLDPSFEGCDFTSVIQSCFGYGESADLESENGSSGSCDSGIACEDSAEDSVKEVEEEIPVEEINEDGTVKDIDCSEDADDDDVTDEEETPAEDVKLDENGNPVAYLMCAFAE